MTGEKALYVNSGFTRRIVGFKQEESEYLLKFLFDHIAKAADYQIRASYAPGSLVVWVSYSKSACSISTPTNEMPIGQPCYSPLRHWRLPEGTKKTRRSPDTTS